MEADTSKMKRVILIRLPGQQNAPTSPIPPNVISHIVNNELRNNSNLASQVTRNANADQTTNANARANKNSDNAGGDPPPDQADDPVRKRTKQEDSVMYKNYSPKQREWMLVYLGYARGLLGMPFEEKLQEVVVQKTTEILRARARFCNINRIPSSKTLRTVWKNLWKEERTVASIIRKGGRPRIDPTLKREKRNERERRKRAVARELKEMRKAEEANPQAPEAT